MNNIIPFNYGDNLVRIINNEETGEPYWIAKDICNVLGINNHRQALSRLDEDERGGVILNDTLGGKQEMSLVNESGMYSLIFSSRKEEAKPFKRWVTHEVLPTIRKTGSYSMHGSSSDIDLSQIIPMIADALVPMVINGVSENIGKLIKRNMYAIGNATQMIENRVEQTNTLIVDSVKDQLSEMYRVNAALRENSKIIEQTRKSMISPTQLAELDMRIEQRAQHLANIENIDMEKARMSIMAQIKKHFNLQRWFLIRQDKYHYVYDFVGKAQLDWSFTPDKGGNIIIEDEQE